MAKSLREQIDDGDITSNEAAAQLSLITAMQRKLKDRERVLRDYCVENIDPKSHITTALGEVAYKRGSEGSWKVKDPVAYAEWLAANGEEKSTVEVRYPLEFATKPDVIEAIVNSHDGVEPDGVEWQNARADSVAVKLPKDWDAMFGDPKVLKQVPEQLGIEAGDTKQNEEKPVEEEDSEEWSWEAN